MQVTRLPLLLSFAGLLASLAIFVTSFGGVTWPMGCFVLQMGAMALAGPILVKFPRTTDPSTQMLHREEWVRFRSGRPRWLLTVAVLAGASGAVHLIALFILNRPKHMEFLPFDSRVNSSLMIAAFCFHVFWYWPPATRGE
jgi:hypothetical protein